MGIPDGNFNGVELLWLAGIVFLAWCARYAAYRAAEQREARERRENEEAIATTAIGRVRLAYEEVGRGWDDAVRSWPVRRRRIYDQDEEAA